jgi:hypothetical protein
MHCEKAAFRMLEPVVAAAALIWAEALAAEPGDEVAALAPAAAATEPTPVKSNAAAVMDSLMRIFIGTISPSLRLGSRRGRRRAQ